MKRQTNMAEKNKLSLSVQYPDPRLKNVLPRPLLRRWVKAALLGPAQLTLRFVDAEEGQILNCDYRHKNYPTNVLTFEYGEETVEADIVLCTDVLMAEAAEQNKGIDAHAAHLIVHGVLHAQGYEHEDDDEAEEMEALETEILEKLGFPNPYQ